MTTSMWLVLSLVLVLMGIALLIITTMAILRRRRDALVSTPPAIEEPRRFERPTPPALHARPTSHTPPAASAPQESFSTSSQVVEAQRLFNLMGDAEELAARLSLQLNEQAERLQRLIRTADDRIVRLSELAAGPRPVIPHVEEPPPPPMPVRAPAPPMPPSPVVTRPMRTSLPVGAAAAQSRPAPRPAAPSPAWNEPAASGGLDPLTAEIYRLADDGLAVVDIAKQLGQHTGKIELILALRQG